MNDDFEEAYDEDEFDDESDILDDIQDAKDEYDNIKKKYDEYQKKNKGNKESNSVNPQQEARDFDKHLRDNNLARNSSQAAQTTVETTSGTTATAAGTATATATEATAATTAGTVAGTTAATAAEATAATTAGTTAATAAAAGGTAVAAGGAVAAQAAIPVVGWIALAIEAAIALMLVARKAVKKHDKKMTENGIDSKKIRKLMKTAPYVLPIAIVILIIIILVQSETQDKVSFLNEAVRCFESNKGCKDFMNTGVKINGIDADLIRATDMQIAGFVVDYVKAENKYYGSEGSSYMSDIVNELDEISKEGLVDEVSVLGSIEEKLKELIDNSIIGDIRYAWNLFKWMKVEKIVYRKIDWYKSHLDTASGYTTLTTLKEWATVKILKEEPSIAFGDTETKEALAVDLNPFNSYLPTPLDIDVDKCIEAAKPYIPSWVELYAVYVSTGDYGLANDIYDYYVSDQYKLEITLYELTTVKKTQHIEGEETTDYVVEYDGKKEVMTKKEYEDKVAEGSQGFFSWLGDKLQELIDGAKVLFEEVVEYIKEFIGFNIKVSTSYVPVVTKGNAFKYSVKQNYKIVTEKETVMKYKASKKSKKSGITTLEYSDGDETKKAKYYIQTVAYIDDKITTWTNKLQYISSSIKKYDEDNRFAQAFVDVVEQNEYKYTIDDIAIALEIIEALYGEKYMSTGSSIDYSALPEGNFGWPVPSNKVVSALFGYTSWYGATHGGIDIWAVDSSGNVTASFNYVGKIDVVAAQSGTVLVASDSGCADGNRVSKTCGGSYGNFVKIKHDNNYITVYAHLSPGTIAVSTGQHVTAGQYLGKMGSSGNSSGTHLHYEIQFDGNRLDPLAFYVVEPYNYKVPYETRNNNEITMANPYRVNFSI